MAGAESDYAKNQAVAADEDATRSSKATLTVTLTYDRRSHTLFSVVGHLPWMSPGTSSW